MLRRGRCFAITAFVASFLAAPARAAVDSRLQLDVVEGYESNPLELHEGAEPAPYTQASFGATLALQWSRRAGAFLRANGSGRSYASSASDADRLWGDLEMGLAVSPYRRGDKRLSLAFGGRGALMRSTFIDPATGQVYIVTPDPNTAVAVPHRFDYNSAAAFLDLRWRVHQRVLLALDTEAGRRHYVQDYTRSTGLDPLDDRSLTVVPGVRLDLTDLVGLDFSFEWTDRRFDRLDSLDETGGPVQDARRRYRYTGGLAALRLELSKRWTLRSGLRRTQRSDLFAGYYDSTGTFAFASSEFSATRGLRFGLDLSQRDTRYAHATVDGDPNGARRRGAGLRAAGRAEKDLGGHVTVLVEAGADRADDRDPLYQYDRNWAQAGLRLKL